MRRIAQLLILVGAAASVLHAEEPVDLGMIHRIKAEGLGNSQAFEILRNLTDVSGPRLTGSPGLQKASQWSRDKLGEWGLVNAQLEPWGEFGVGWSLEKSYLAMTQPYYQPLIATPSAWTAGSGGLIRGTPMLLKIEEAADLEKYKGKLAGQIVLISTDREADTHFQPDARRRSAEDLEELALAPEPRGGPSNFAQRRRQWRARAKLREETEKLLRAEGALAVLQAGRGQHGTVFASGGRPPKEGQEPNLPTLVVALEHFKHMQRLLENESPLEIELELQTRFHRDDLQAYNVVAEIPGSDPALAQEVVMLGGHIDSWHAGTGATDNAAGVAVAMEAVRILKAIDARPRRTIRIALWSGEEQGLLGSRAYVEKHFADRKTMTLRPAHHDFSAYFNLDNGTGKIRGIYLQENDAVRPIFEAYLKPFEDLAATTLAIRNTGGTDHLSFDRVGLPGFQFIQDPIDYSTRTHHSNMDLSDHVQEADLMQASVIMASFVYHAAMRDEKLPRKPLPKPEEEAVPAGVTEPVAAGRSSSP